MCIPLPLMSLTVASFIPVAYGDKCVGRAHRHQPGCMLRFSVRHRSCLRDDYLATVIYFVGNVNFLAGRKQQGMAPWRDSLFARMATNTEDVTASYQLPQAQTMTVGLNIGI